MWLGYDLFLAGTAFNFLPGGPPPPGLPPPDPPTEPPGDDRPPFVPPMEGVLISILLLDFYLSANVFFSLFLKNYKPIDMFPYCSLLFRFLECLRS